MHVECSLQVSSSARTMHSCHREDDMRLRGADSISRPKWPHVGTKASQRLPPRVLMGSMSRNDSAGKQSKQKEAGKAGHAKEAGKASKARQARQARQGRQASNGRDVVIPKCSDLFRDATSASYTECLSICRVCACVRD